jgi:hypothetical protein
MHERTAEILHEMPELLARVRRDHPELCAVDGNELLQRLRAGELPDYVEVLGDELSAVEGMNRHERRAWAAQRRRERRPRPKAGGR